MATRSLSARTPNEPVQKVNPFATLGAAPSGHRAGARHGNPLPHFKVLEVRQTAVALGSQYRQLANVLARGLQVMASRLYSR